MDNKLIIPTSWNGYNGINIIVNYIAIFIFGRNNRNKICERHINAVGVNMATISIRKNLKSIKTKNRIKRLREIIKTLDKKLQKRR